MSTQTVLGPGNSNRKRKKQIYGGVVILLLVVIGIIAYPKITEEIAY